MLQYQFRPIDHWPGEPSKSRHGSPFSAAWSQTLDLLERELRHLNARDIVIQAAVGLEDIRNDGMLKANARPRGPGVIVSFHCKHGELSYPCDTYMDWQANVRAIALSLEALRAVNRHGVTRRAEQYQGWAKLEGPTKSTASALEDAALLLAKYHVVPFRQIVASRETFELACRVASTKTHPDVGGTPEEFKRFQAAKELLDRHFAGK